MGVGSNLRPLDCKSSVLTTGPLICYDETLERGYVGNSLHSRFIRKGFCKDSQRIRKMRVRKVRKKCTWFARIREILASISNRLLFFSHDFPK